MATLSLQIVTPTETAFADTTTSVTLPGTVGELGILPGHLPLMTTLKPGTVRAATAHGERSFAVGFGFAEVSGDTVRVLVDACHGADSIDAAHAKAALAELERQISTSEFKTREELDEATREAARTRARLALVERATKTQH
ncbi:MAG: ATP synthase F1 subunit epsilon [Myxococcales bacterium]|nr:ATP synthase F1 subunit epsilon [Myxococcales bacterium]MCB9532044.1 ATP synthase F1 subunit epsilon [Myxococcales bacterium]